MARKVLRNIKIDNQIEKTEEMIIEELNDNFYKIKECLSRCGNVVKNISEKEKIKEILYSFINKRMYNNEK